MGTLARDGLMKYLLSEAKLICIVINNFQELKKIKFQELKNRKKLLCS